MEFGNETHYEECIPKLEFGNEKRGWSLGMRRTTRNEKRERKERNEIYNNRWK